MAVGVLLLFSWVESRSLAPAREHGMLPIDPPTPFYHFLPASPVRGKILVVHGMDASKDFMKLFCAALADGGFEVFAIDLPGHGESPVGFTIMRARDAVARALDYLGTDLVVGHSLGAGLLLDIANERGFQRMVLLSPGPTPIDHIDFSHTLVVTGTFDIPAINEFVPRLEGAEWWRLPRAGHSSAVFDPNVTRRVVGWLGGDAGHVRAASRLRWNFSLLVCAIALGVVLIGRGSASVSATSLDRPQILGLVVLAGTASVLILRLIPLMRWLHLFATDYLVGLVFLTGVILVAAAYDRRFSRFQQRGLIEAGKPAVIDRRYSGVLLATLAAGYAIGVVGFFAAGVFTRFSLSDGRWWRFSFIALASFPFFYFDELQTRRSFVTAALARGVLGCAMAMGVLTFERSAAFLVIVTHLMILFWIGLWMLTGVVRRRTGDPLAAAIFASLIQGWLFAAWFITT